MQGIGQENVATNDQVCDEAIKIETEIEDNQLTEVQESSVVQTPPLSPPDLKLDIKSEIEGDYLTENELDPLAPLNICIQTLTLVNSPVRHATVFTVPQDLQMLHQLADVDQLEGHVQASGEASE